MSGTKVAGYTFTPFITPFTMAVFMRHGYNNFAQLASFDDTTIFSNYDLLMGQTGNISANVIDIMTP